MEYKRITDDEILDIIRRIEESPNHLEDEQLGKEAFLVNLKLQFDIRQFLRKMYKNLLPNQKVYKQPTGNKKDIIVGR